MHLLSLIPLIASVLALGADAYITCRPNGGDDNLPPLPEELVDANGIKVKTAAYLEDMAKTMCYPPNGGNACYPTLTDYAFPQAIEKLPTRECVQTFDITPEHQVVFRVGKPLPYFIDALDYYLCGDSFVEMIDQCFSKTDRQAIRAAASFDDVKGTLDEERFVLEFRKKGTPLGENSIVVRGDDGMELFEPELVLKPPVNLPVDSIDLHAIDLE